MYAVPTVNNNDLVNPDDGTVLDCPAVKVPAEVSLITMNLSTGNAPDEDTVAPALRWSITIAPLMMRFLKPKVLGKFA